MLHLIPTIYNFRLCIESPVDNASGCLSDAWCYDGLLFVDALVAHATWDGQGDPPGRWKKHVTTGRRGPGAEPFDPADDEAA